jgi:ankyrin repeat protein
MFQIILYMKFKNIDNITQFYKNGINYQRKRDNWSYLHYIIMNGSNISFCDIVTSGINLNLQTKKGMTTLMLASRWYGINNWEFWFKLLIKFGSKLDIQNKDGLNALMLGIMNENKTCSLKIIDMLLKAGADPNIQNNNKESSLTFLLRKKASICKRTCDNQSICDNQYIYNVAKLLLKYGANINIRDHLGPHDVEYIARLKCYNLFRLFLDYDIEEDLSATIYFSSKFYNIATKNNDIDFFKNLVHNSKNKNNKLHVKGLKHILMSHDDNFDFLKKTIKKVNNINDVFGKWNTILSWVINQKKITNRREKIKILIDHGVNINAKTHTSNKHFECRILDVLIYCLFHFRKGKTLANVYGYSIEQCKNKYCEYELILADFIDRGIELNYCNELHFKLIFMPDLFRLLLKKGLDVSHPYLLESITLYMIRTHTLSFELIDSALSNGCVLDKLILHKICASQFSRNFGKCVKFFVDNGIDINVCDDGNDDNTILIKYIACDYQNINILKLLLESGADPNITNNLGYTALMKCATGGCGDDYYYCAKLLLDYGADTTIVNNNGEGILDFVHSEKMIELILNKNDQCYELNECCICYDTKPNVKFKPCGHIAMCGICFEKFDCDDPCPICRSKIMIVDYNKLM